MGGGEMRVYFLNKRQLKRSGLFALLFLMAFVSAVQARGIQRRVFGVKPGVMLDKLTVGGLLPDELTKLLKEIAVIQDREARNAMYFSETGEIIPEQAGICVDVAATVHTVFRAPTSAHLSLITKKVPAAIDRSYFTPVFRGSPSDPRVALSINVAWGEESLPAMLEILKKNKIKATFFFIGDWVEKFPDSVKAVAADGHEIGNHGSYHGHPCSLSRSELSRLILDNNVLLTKVTGRQPPALFAPPSGEFDRRTVGVAAELGFRTILWTVDTIDWRRPSPDLIKQKVMARICNGAIILMHPTAPTVAALPGIIQEVQAKGFRFTTVGSLLP